MKIRRIDSNRRKPRVINTGVDTSAPDSHYVSDGCGSVFNWMKAQQREEALARRTAAAKRAAAKQEENSK